LTEPLNSRQGSAAAAGGSLSACALLKSWDRPHLCAALQRSLSLKLFDSRHPAARPMIQKRHRHRHQHDKNHHPRHRHDGSHIFTDTDTRHILHSCQWRNRDSLNDSAWRETHVHRVRGKTPARRDGREQAMRVERPARGMGTNDALTVAAEWKCMRSQWKYCTHGMESP
jgi:hypothetical protein